MAYNYQSEIDPLLPNHKRAPEIQGSRPQSINNEYVIEEQVSDDDARPHRKGFNDIMAVIFVICLFVSMYFVLFHDGSLGDLFGDERPSPRTLDERVTRILDETPLIGIYDTHGYECLLTGYRWT